MLTNGGEARVLGENSPLALNTGVNASAVFCIYMHRAIYALGSGGQAAAARCQQLHQPGVYRALPPRDMSKILTTHIERLDATVSRVAFPGIGAPPSRATCALLLRPYLASSHRRDPHHALTA
jgi:hypothetical protein